VGWFALFKFEIGFGTSIGPGYAVHAPQGRGPRAAARSAATMLDV